MHHVTRLRRYDVCVGKVQPGLVQFGIGHAQISARVRLLRFESENLLAGRIERVLGAAFRRPPGEHRPDLLSVLQGGCPGLQERLVTVVLLLRVRERGSCLGYLIPGLGDLSLLRFDLGSHIRQAGRGLRDLGLCLLHGDPIVAVVYLGDERSGFHPLMVRYIDGRDVARDLRAYRELTRIAKGIIRCLEGTRFEPPQGASNQCDGYSECQRRDTVWMGADHPYSAPALLCSVALASSRLQLADRVFEDFRWRVLHGLFSPRPRQSGRRETAIDCIWLRAGQCRSA